MKKTSSLRKFKLEKDTLRLLSQVDLQKAEGASPLIPSVNYCPSVHTKPCSV